MNFEVNLERTVAKTLDRLDRPTEQRLRKRIKELAIDPYDARLSSPLTGMSGIRRSRVGDWRIAFLVNLQTRVIDIVAIQPRGQVYKRI